MIDACCGTQTVNNICSLQGDRVLMLDCSTAHPVQQVEMDLYGPYSRAFVFNFYCS